MRPRVLLTRLWPTPALDRLTDEFEVVVDPADRPLTSAELRQALSQFDAVCPTVTDRVETDVIDGPGTRVRILANFGAGTDHIDLATAKARGILVTNTPDVLTDATAELAVLLMLMVSRRASEGERQLRAGEWTGWRPTHLMGRSLSGARLGLVGFGRIAQATARLASEAFGMEVGYFSRRPAGAEWDARAVRYDTLDQLLSEADVISLHCPGGAETHHLIDERRLRLMKPSTILINTARGTVVDEAALAEALGNRRLAGAGLDVYESEPKVSGALLSQPNAVLLPHLGSATLETRTAMGLRAAENLRRFFRGEQPPDRVA